MRLEFELKGADFYEAQTIIQGTLHRRRALSRVLSAIWTMATFLIYAILFDRFAPRKTVAGVPSVFGDVVMPLIPWISILSYAATMLYFRVRSRNRPWDLSPAGGKRG